MKARYRRSKFFDQRTGLLVEWHAPSGLRYGRDLKSPPLIERRTKRLPSLDGGLAWGRHRMAEEVEIEESIRFFAEFPDCSAYFIKVLQCAGEGSKSPAFADCECQRYRIRPPPSALE